MNEFLEGMILFFGTMTAFSAVLGVGELIFEYVLPLFPKLEDFILGLFD